MSLKVELKAGERLLVGDCMVTNQGQRTRLCIDGHVPVLREKDIMTASAADTPAKRLYLAIQTFYLSRDRASFDAQYRALKVLNNGRDGVDLIGALLEAGEVYKAMKQARLMIDEEGRGSPFFSSAQINSGLPELIHPEWSKSETSDLDAGEVGRETPLPLGKPHRQ